MRVTKYLTILLFAALCCVAPADWIAKQTTIADLSKATTSLFTKHNSSVTFITANSSGPVTTVKFNGYQSYFGQDYATAQDWSAYNIVDMYLTNKSTTDETFKLVVQFNQNPDDYTNAFTGEFTVYAKSSKHFVCYLNTDDPLPYGFKYLNPVLTADAWEVFNGARDLHTTWHWRLSYQGTNTNSVDISSLRLIRQSLTFQGIADMYGQYTDRTWPTKVKANSDLTNQAAAERTDNFNHPGTGEMLGTTAVANPARVPGKWSIVTLSNGNKFLQHPNGNLFWSLGLNGVTDSLPTRVQDRTSYFQYLPSTTGFFASCYCTMNTPAGSKQCYSFRKQNLMLKYGSSYMTPWTGMVKNRLASWGFNTLGIDTNSALLNSTVPFIYDVSTNNFGTRVKPPYVQWGSLPDPYAATFLSWCQSTFKTALAPYVANQNLMGVFSDNEMSWGNMDDNPHRYNVVLGVLASPATQPAKIAFVNQVTTKYGTIAALNSAWGTSFAGFSTILNTTTWKPSTYTSGMISDFQTFVSAYATKYYSQVRSALSTAGLKSLYLGTRFSDYTNEVINAATPNVDVLSFNIYRFRWDVPFGYYNSLKKPVLISEFGYTLRALGTFGGPASMPGSSGRAYRIQEFLDAAITQPNVIGAHYYCYADEPITGRYSDYEDGGFGVVDVTDEPYADSVNVFRNFTADMYTVRAAGSGGGTSGGTGGGTGGGTNTTALKP